MMLSRRCRMALAVFAWSVVCGPAGLGDVARESVDPILRLDLPGHTGEVRALAFTPDSSRLISGGRDKVAIVWTFGKDGDPADGDDGTGESGSVARHRLMERALRWQVARGTRGAIQAIAVSPGNLPGVVAIAGSGAMGSTGEILLLDARDGTLVKTLGGGDRVGHRQSVAALDFTADGTWLVSQDLDGQVFAWQRAAEWQPTELVARDETRLGGAGAAGLRRMPPVRPLATVGVDRVALPALVSPPDAEMPVWRIQVVKIGGAEGERLLLPAEHYGIVTAVSVSPGGETVASADLAGNVHVVRPDNRTPAIRIEVKPAAESLAIIGAGSRLAVGVAGGAGQRPRLEIWETAPLRRIDSRDVPSSVRAVRASRDGKWLAWSGADRHAVTVEPLQPDAAKVGERKIRLGGVGQNITRVAFAKVEAKPEPAPGGAPGPEPTQRNVVRRKKAAGVDGDEPPWPRRLAVGTGAFGAVPPPLENAFNLETLAREAEPGEAGWAPSEGRPGTWALRRGMGDSIPRGVERWELRHGDAGAGIIDLALDWQGRAGADGRAVAWLARADDPEPWAVAIGTDRGIFIYRLDKTPGQVCQLLRRFRGHEDTVLSLAVSDDGRWLASGGGDALVMLWSLSDLGRERPLTERWGVGLDVVNGRAVVTAIDEAGPLAGKDVRVGDVVTKVSWAEGRDAATRKEHADGAAVVAALSSVAWSMQVAFWTERDGKALEAFQRFPAWENLAALHLAANREWAFWTPRGYYAASANGDTLFGWLVNRGLDRLPRFFRAQQFRRKLERPDVMSRLLVAGSLGAALRGAVGDVPKSTAVVLPEQIGQTPEVRIISPKPGAVIEGRTLRVMAEVEEPEGAEVDRIRAYGSGAVAAGEPRLVEDVPAAEGRPRKKVYAWDVGLPAQDSHLVQVFAGTRAGPTDVQEVPVDAVNRAAVERRREPRLYLIASGVDRYAHVERFQQQGLEMQNLAFAVADARSVRASLARRSLELYDLVADQMLADAEVTRDGWRKAVRALADRLRDDVEPDDLLVVFLAGHGMVNAAGDRAYSYLCHDAEFADLTTEGEPVPKPEGVITWQDFQILERIPCRKLALVDTCHSGALGGPPVRSGAVREFQENMIVVLAAASDDEPSQEADAWGHGAFTKVLLEALDGDADVGRNRSRRSDPEPIGQRGGAAADSRAAVGEDPGTPDGIVSLDEVVDYVLERVPELTRGVSGDSNAQHPTVSPTRLVPYVKLPLSRVGRDEP